jgi:8-oxo-dGTP diphosphatase
MPKIHVTAALFQNGDKFLIAQRKKSDKLGLHWEFPGGKIEKNETPEMCLKRELKEEFNIDAIIGRLFHVSNYKYPDFEIVLMTYLIDFYDGKFILNSHERIEWISINDFDNFKFAPADVPILKKIMREQNG